MERNNHESLRYQKIKEEIAQMSDDWPLNFVESLSTVARMLGKDVHWSQLARLAGFLIRSGYIVPEKVPYRNSQIRKESAFHPRHLVPLVLAASFCGKDRLSNNYLTATRRQFLREHLDSQGFSPHQKDN